MKNLIKISAISLLLFGVIACNQTAGEKLEERMEDKSDQLEDRSDDLEDAADYVEDGVDAMEEALEKFREALEEIDNEEDRAKIRVRINKIIDEIQFKHKDSL